MLDSINQERGRGLIKGNKKKQKLTQEVGMNFNFQEEIMKLKEVQ